MEGAVIAKELHSLLSKMKDEEIEVSEKDGAFFVKGKKTKSAINMYSEIKLPVDEIELTEDWEDLSEDFNEAISFNLFSISKDRGMPILNYAHLIDDRVESTDNYRITAYRTDIAIADELFISYSVIVELIKYNMTHYQTSDNWIHFKDKNDLVFSCRTIADKYPDLIPHLKVEGEKVKLPKTITEMIERCRVFTAGSKAADEVMKVILFDGKFAISAKSSAGWIKESEKIRYSGDKISFKVNPGFLIQILSHQSRVTVGESKLKFTTDKMEHAILLLAEDED